MSQLSKKKQEIKDRGAELLRIARRLFLERGFNGLTMENIAGKTAYSKGTIYQHFSCKEDVLAVLCIEGYELRLNLLQRASVFQGRSRERALALGVAHDLAYRLKPDLWRIEDMVSSSPLREKLSSERKAKLDMLQERSFGVVLGVIRDAIVSGDLDPPQGLSPEQVFIGLVSAIRGLFETSSSTWWDPDWSPDFWDTHQKLVSAICDGFNWRPYGKDWDYPSTLRRIWKEVFPEEYLKQEGPAKA